MHRQPRKTDIEGADVTCWRRLFQVWAAAKTNEVLCMVLIILITIIIIILKIIIIIRIRPDH